MIVTLFRMGIFGAVNGSGVGGEKKGPPPLPKISHTYPTMKELAAVIPYLK